jgi:iron complex transport system substrate-binding protein
MKLRVVLIFLLLLARLFGGAAESPCRVVSLNLLADHWLLELAGPGQIAALTFLAHDPAYCPRWEEARHHLAVRGAVEEVLRLQPDLVLAGRWGAAETVAMLKRLGVRVEVLDSPEDFPGIVAQARAMGVLLGRPEAADAFVARLETRLAAVRAARPAKAVTTLDYSQNGWVHGAGSPIGHLFDEAGAHNLAADHGIGWIGRVSLEELIRWKPEAMVVPAPLMRAPSLADELWKHPVFTRVAAGATVITLPEGTTDFGGPYTIDGLEALAAGLRTAAEGRRP